MDQALNNSVEKRISAGGEVHWHDSWHLRPGDFSPIDGEAVTIVYDLVEWMALSELADYGRDLYAGKKFTRPGDDFDELPTEMSTLPWKAIYEGQRQSFLAYIAKPDANGSHAINQFEERLFKVPAETQIKLAPLPRRYGVAEFGKEPVRSICIANPAGFLVIEPSQIGDQ